MESSSDPSKHGDPKGTTVDSSKGNGNYSDCEEEFENEFLPLRESSVNYGSKETSFANIPDVESDSGSLLDLPGVNKIGDNCETDANDSGIKLSDNDVESVKVDTKD